MKKNNRYLFVLPTSSIGGAERVAMNLVLHLLEDKKNFVVILLLGGGSLGPWSMLEGSPNLTIEFFANIKERKGFLMGIQWAMHNKSSFDYAFSTHTHVNAFVALLRRIKLLKIRNHIARESTVIFDRFFGLKRILMKVLYSFYGNVDLVICQTNYMRKRFLAEVSSVDKFRVIQLSNPLNLKYIVSKVGQEKAPDIESTDNLTTIVQVGRLVDIKNHVLSLNALKLVAAKRKVKLLIVGDGPMKGALKELVDELKLTSSVTFVGQTSNPYSYMAIADIGILSSKKEGFPNVIIEMMAAGTKQIISSDCCDGLHDLPSVKIVRQFSAESFAAAILDSIESGADNRERYRIHSMERDVATFWEDVISHLDQAKLTNA